MKREDYIELIEVAEGVRELEDTLQILCGNCRDYSDGTSLAKLIKVIDVLSSNALPRYDFVNNDEDCSKQFHDFFEVIDDTELSAEEKCDILIGANKNAAETEENGLAER